MERQADADELGDDCQRVQCMTRAHTSTEPRQHKSPGRHLRRKDPQRGQAGRYAGRATDSVRASRQSEDRERARAHRAAIDPRPRRRGHRVRQANGR